MYVLPLNPLFTIIFIRLIIGRLGSFALARGENLFFVTVVCLVLLFPSLWVMEYAGPGLLIALFGYIVRNSGDAALIRKMFWVTIMIAVISQISISFNVLQLAVVVTGMAGALYMLTYGPKSGDWPVNLPAAIRVFMQFCGRRTLELYVGQLVLFKLAGVIFGLGLPIYGVMAWDWTMADAYMPLMKDIKLP
jgi:hypothetical protein